VFPGAPAAFVAAFRAFYGPTMNELGLKRKDLVPVLTDLAETMTVVPTASLAPLLSRCEIALREAVASRNGPTKDAHVLALAWQAEADVWSTDRDFAGTGIATWSTPNLLRALAEAEAAEV
jgi:hypothetical protein